MLSCLRRASTRLSTAPACRYVSSASSNPSLSPTHSIYASNSTNPYFNLSLEDWLFKHKSHNEPLLLLYRDDPCVIIGRNQNPWKEVNLPTLRKAGIPFVRRRSGGGTVYHDIGNTNFSIHLPRSSFDRHVTAQLVLRAVCSLGIDANVNDRNDICVGTDKINVSGSAYKIVNMRAYHHGTMLISTRLDMLGDMLRSRKETMITKGVASVRSPVCNLQQFNASVSHGKFVDAVVTEFRKAYKIDEEIQVVNEDEETKNIKEIQDGMAELPEWNWAYGQTPEFTYRVHRAFPWADVQAEIRSKHGVILDISFRVVHGSLSGIHEELQRLGKALEGQRYGFVDEEYLVPEVGDASYSQHVWTWLKDEMSN